MKHLSCLFVSIGLLLWAGSTSAQQVETTIEPEPALEARLADESLLLDLTRFNGGFVAVGQRGHVLLSDDGRTWTQADQVPVQSTLTRIAREGRRMWAAGHDSVILSSADGGRTWFIQNWDPEAEEPLLDIEFLTALKGFAVGAYGRFMSTADGGVTWETEHIQDRLSGEAIDWAAIARAQGGIDTMSGDIDVPANQETAAGEEIFIDKGCYEFLECHLNDLLVLEDERMMIAAERGYGYRSTDLGATWESFRFPYSGSMFGLIELDGCIIAYGLRGNIQKSCDFGDSWERLDYPGDQTLMGATYLPDGRVLMVGAAATRVTLDADGNLEIESDRLGSDYAAVLVDDGHRILVGEDGVRYD
ncbi:hypothetical protein HFP89_15160 [Wenzhouxiangella sp. XN79A]|uniref:WD40/YVTN/BNR-like repeat-containing protein n=1 Tax=Wenzhouxiangella sp. XN79A TaxID=2724193 RepID=UPI00144ACDFC|nr:hypothetical protein [Wenzhouxiangella sp. XN79A]NKI36508.1 hypothetical protein [Wenzhouxiangella sp. XN79A]